jgi:hypothetical protein
LTVIELNDIEFENSIQEVSYAEAYLKRNGNTRENNLPDFKGKLIILYTLGFFSSMYDSIIMEIDFLFLGGFLEVEMKAENGFPTSKQGWLGEV